MSNQSDITQDVERIASCCTEALDVENTKLSDEYYYQSLPFCVIDAVFSIGANYTSTRNVVIRYCRHFNLQRIRDNRDDYPSKETQHSIDVFLDNIKGMDYHRLAQSLFQNRQRTSTKNGILKAEAVVRSAQVLKEYNVHYLNDVENVIDNDTFGSSIMSIPGQASGISLNYFYMLSGSDDFCKPDRFIRRFIEGVIGREVGKDEAEVLLTETHKQLEPRYPNLTLRLLDHTIWSYERQRDKDSG